MVQNSPSAAQLASFSRITGRPVSLGQFDLGRVRLPDVGEGGSDCHPSGEPRRPPMAMQTPTIESLAMPCRCSRRCRAAEIRVSTAAGCVGSAAADLAAGQLGAVQTADARGRSERRRC